MKKLALTLITSISGIFIFNSAKATSFEIHTSINPPYVEEIGNSEKEAKGVALEIVIGAFQNNKKGIRITLFTLKKMFLGKEFSQMHKIKKTPYSFP